MRQDDLEQAITALEATIEDEFLKEEVFQKLFEDKPAILEALGYRRSWPHPRLLDQSEDEWIPDFLAEPVNMMGEVLELKRPKVELTYGTSRRDGFRSAVGIARNQVRDYTKLFRDERQREYVREKYGLVVPAEPNTVIVIGKQRDIEPEDLFEFGRDLLGVRIVSYDEVVGALELRYNQEFGDVQSVPGATFQMIASLDAPQDSRRTYVFDTNSDGSASRWSLYLQDNRLCFEVVDNDGVEHRVALTAGRDFEYGQFASYWCEIGNSSRYFVMSVRVNGQLAEQFQRAGGIPLDPINDKGYEVFGMKKLPGWLSAEGHVPAVAPAAGRLSAHIVWQQTIPFRARVAVNENQFPVVADAETQPFTKFPGPDGWSAVSDEVKYAPKVVLPNPPANAEDVFMTRFYDQTAEGEAAQHTTRA